MYSNKTRSPITRSLIIGGLFATALVLASVGTPALHAEDNGVLCRFTGQTWPGGNPSESWSRRWSNGPGVRQINDDCEAIIALEDDAEPQWVGTTMPPRLHYVKARAEIGISDNFEIVPGQQVVFMELVGTNLSGVGHNPPYLARVSIGRTMDGHPDDYELHFGWNSDTEQGSYIDGPYRLGPKDRLLVRADWEVSTDSDRDFQPDPNGAVTFSVQSVDQYVEKTLIIDQTSATEIRFGYHSGVPAGTRGELYVRPLGIDTGYFDPKD